VRRRRVTVTLIEAPGAEMWYAVKHAGGFFKVPSWISAYTLFDLARRGATDGGTRYRAGEPRVSITLSRLQELEAIERVSHL
jgi:hypothetical protein